VRIGVYDTPAAEGGKSGAWRNAYLTISMLKVDTSRLPRMRQEKRKLRMPQGICVLKALKQSSQTSFTVTASSRTGMGTYLLNHHFQTCLIFPIPPKKNCKYIHP
jgi:hypothetical protein